MLEVETSPTGLMLRIFVQPRSSRNQIAGLHGGALKVKITAPPVEGAANQMCIRFLARQLGIAKSRLEIVSGLAGRTKRLLIAAAPEDQAELKKRLLALAG